MQLDKLAGQTFNMLVNTPGNIASVVKGALGIIQAGVGSIYRSILGLFSPDRPPHIHHTLLDISVAIEQDIPDHKELLNDRASLRSLLQPPEIFKGGMPGSERALKQEISSNAAALLSRLNENYELRERSVLTFNRINALLHKHGLSDSAPFQLHNLGEMLTRVIDSNSRSLNWKESKDIAVSSRRASVQDAVLQDLEENIAGMEAMRWERGEP